MLEESLLLKTLLEYGDKIKQETLSDKIYIGSKNKYIEVDDFKKIYETIKPKRKEICGG